MKKLSLTLLAILLFLQLNSCLFFSSYQSAKMLDKQGVEVTALLSAQEDHHEIFETNPIRHIGVQGAYGFSKRFNLRARYAYMVEKDLVTGSVHVNGVKVSELVDDVSSSYIDIEPKVGVGSKDRLAFSLPIGLILEDGDTEFQLTPTAFFSLNPTEWLALNFAIKSPYVVTDSVIYGAMTTGVTLSASRVPLTITPEFGFLWGDGEKRTSFGFAFGFLKQ